MLACPSSELVLLVQILTPCMPRGEKWIDLLEQGLSTLSELCQGNSESQGEALDNLVMSAINGIFAYETTKEAEQEQLTAAKRAALGLLEAFMEQSNAKSVKQAWLIYNSLNLGSFCWAEDGRLGS